MKPILNLHLRDIDENFDNHLVVGGGYEYRRILDSGTLKIHNTIIAYATPNISLAGLLPSDRNRTEFRWINGIYDFRYRNRLTIARVSQVGTFKFTPYAYGELLYNSNHRSWNEREYASGVQLPYRSRLMIDTYLLHESCTSCSHGSVNMIGLTLNLYLRQIN